MKHQNQTEMNEPDTETSPDLITLEELQDMADARREYLEESGVCPEDADAE